LRFYCHHLRLAAPGQRSRRIRAVKRLVTFARRHGDELPANLTYWTLAQFERRAATRRAQEKEVLAEFLALLQTLLGTRLQ
jgi:hypothetical protein